MTNKKRIEAVKDAIDSIESSYPQYICVALTRHLPNFERDPFKYFPELLKHKPVKTFQGSVWFHPSDTKSRIDILNKVLTEIQNQDK